MKESEFTPEQRNRYSRQILIEEIGEEGQLRLLKTRILLVGAGGLGSSAGLYLAGAGVGTLGIADFDVVDMSNLNRQVFHGVADVGRAKVESARAAIARLNPDVKVVTCGERIGPGNILKILEDYDMVIDAADNVETKFLLNDACFFAGKPCIYGGAVQFEGQMSVFHPKGGGPCLRCLLPVPPVDDPTLRCSRMGVLGAVPGLIGAMQAAEALKIALGIGAPLVGRYFIYHALQGRPRLVELEKNPLCPLCGEAPSIRGLE